MPAEAELLCDYFLSSKLSTKKKSTEPISAAAVLLKQKQSNGINAGFASNATNFESIDFVKYEKNPMDYLKSKYTLLNGKTAVESQLIGSDAQPNASTTETASKKVVKEIKQKEVLPNMSWGKLKRNGVGLLNIGNNCYLNATLQCLAYTAPFSQWLITRPHSSVCRLKRQKGFCSLCDVERIICEVFSSTGCAKPNALCMNIRKISRVFGVGRQEDASEFFTTLLESMIQAMHFPNKPEGHKKLPATMLDDIFSFQFRSRVTCCTCNRVSDTIENNNTWPVDVKHHTDIRRGMLQFLREEILDGHNAYKCTNCHKKSRATKRYSLRKAPNVLVVHLKRFDFSVNGKLSHHVAYPETLNLKNLSQAAGDEKNSKSSMYQLYGVLVHLGHTSRSGHYYSYVKGPNDTWLRADDSRVNKVQVSEAMSQRAYMLFYKRLVTDPAPVDPTPSAIEKPAFNLNSKSAYVAPKTMPAVAENGVKVNRNNLLNDLISTCTNGVKEPGAKYSYSKPSNELSTKEKVTENVKETPKNLSNGFKSNELISNGSSVSNGHHNGQNGHHNGTISDDNSTIKPSELTNGHSTVSKLNENNQKTTKKQKIRLLTEKILKLKKVLIKKPGLEKKQLRLKKLVRRRKTLRKLVAKNKKKSATNLVKIDNLEAIPATATKPVFTKVTALMDQPLSSDVCESTGVEKQNVLKALKQAAATSSLMTWDEKESSLLVKEGKKKSVINSNKRPRYEDDLDGLSIDSDEYNEEFDMPQIRDKKPKFLAKQRREENGFHKYTHGLNGRLKTDRPSFNGSRNGSVPHNQRGGKFNRNKPPHR